MAVGGLYKITPALCLMVDFKYKCLTISAFCNFFLSCLPFCLTGSKIARGYAGYSTICVGSLQQAVQQGGCAKACYQTMLLDFANDCTHVKLSQGQGVVGT